MFSIKSNNRLPKTRKWFIHINLAIAIMISNLSFVILAEITTDKVSKAKCSYDMSICNNFQNLP